MTSAELVNILGAAAGLLTTVAFVPQVIKVWRTHSTRDISLTMFSVFCTGVFLWLIYGFIIKSWPVIFANAAVFVLASIILFFKVRYPS